MGNDSVWFSRSNGYVIRSLLVDFRGDEKMIELSFTEIILLVWAGLATGMALHYRQEDKNHRGFVNTLIEHKGLRDEFFDKIDTHKEEHA